MSSECACRARGGMLFLCSDCGCLLPRLDERMLRHAQGDEPDPAAPFQLPGGWFWAGCVREPSGTWQVVALASDLGSAWSMLRDHWPGPDKLVLPYQPAPPRKSQRVQAQVHDHRQACPRCSSTTTRIVPQKFADGSRHRREECGSCGCYLRFVSRRKARYAPGGSRH
jgi:hypothetical protein